MSQTGDFMRAPRLPSLREVLLAGALLSLVAAAVFGSHITNGGFYSDDWSNAATYHYAKSPKFTTVAHGLQHQCECARFVLVRALVLPHAVFGLDKQAHLALAVALAVLAAVCFYVLLRTLGLEPRHAGSMAVLALLFPWSDATRLWPTVGLNNIAIILYFLSVIVAVRGLHVSGVRGVVVHGGAQMLFLLAIFTYEAPLLAIFLSGLIYIHYAPSKRIAFSRWRADVMLGIAAFVAVAILTERAMPSLYELAVASAYYAAGGTALAGHSVFPIGLPHQVAGLAAYTLVVLIAVWSRSSERFHDPDLRRWLVIGSTAVAFIVVADVMYLGSEQPLRHGTDNRGNILAGYGYVVFVYSLIMAVDRLVAMRRGARARVRTSAVAVTATVAVAMGYAVTVRRDVSRWDRAADQQARILRAVKQAVPAPPRRSTIYVTAAPLRVSPGIPIFAEAWDLNSALQLTFGDHSLDAYPIDEQTTFVCERRGMYPSREGYLYGPSGGYGRANGAAYGKALFVNIRTKQAELIRDETHCRAAARRFRPRPNASRLL